MFDKIFKKKLVNNIDSNYVEGILQVPVEGRVLPIDEVPDNIFADRILGDGVAIEPTAGIICAPVDGEVIQIFQPTKHAIGICSKDGIEILIHIGIDTVKMNGDGFKALVQEGDKVVCGQRLMQFDLEKIKEKAKSCITPIIITNSDIVKRMEILSQGQVMVGDDLLKIDK